MPYWATLKFSSYGKSIFFLFIFLFSEQRVGSPVSSNGGRWCLFLLFEHNYELVNFQRDSCVSILLSYSYSCLNCPICGQWVRALTCWLWSSFDMALGILDMLWYSRFVTCVSCLRPEPSISPRTLVPFVRK